MLEASHICTIAGCERRHLARGFCGVHWRRWKRHGDPLAGKISHGSTERFIQSHKNYSSDECLIWPFFRDRNGYGTAYAYGGRFGRLAHRIMCIAAHGDPPSDAHEATHACGQGHTGCVNPRHLRWATHEENMKDKHTHGTQPRGQSHHSATLTDDDLNHIIGLSTKMRQCDIAKHFGVSPSTICAIVRGTYPRMQATEEAR